MSTETKQKILTPLDIIQGIKDVTHSYTVSNQYATELMKYIHEYHPDLQIVFYRNWNEIGKTKISAI